jgi:hypothetical protein
MPDEPAEPGHTDCPDLFYEDPSRLVTHGDFGSEGSRPRASRRWRDLHDGARQHRVRLDDYAIPLPALLVTSGARETQLVDLTAAHEGFP